MNEEADHVIFRVQFKYKGIGPKSNQPSTQHLDEEDAIQMCKQNLALPNETTEDWHVVRITEHSERIYPR